jgi:hypothetical protein
MRKFLLLAAAVGTAATITAAAPAADPITPFPSPTVGQVFVAAQTVTSTGATSNYFAPGATVIFRAYAVDGKTHKFMAAKDVKYFYVTIPNQPNVKLRFDPAATGATGRLPWTGTWTVPASYPEGVVGFKILIKTNAKRIGQFVQMPVSSAQLTVSTKPSPALSGSVGALAGAPGKLDVALYVDSVNGSSPVGAPKRAVGCSQTNVYKRGEQFVLRSWGVDMATGETLTTENVDEAHYSIPGIADIKLAWGAHGATTNRVWFWTNFWNIPADYPLGEVTVKVTFTTDAGKTGTYDYKITIIP